MDRVVLTYGMFVILREKVANAKSMLHALGSIERIVSVRMDGQAPPVKVRLMVPNGNQNYPTLSYDPHQLVPLTDEEVELVFEVYTNDKRQGLEALQKIVKGFTAEVCLPNDERDEEYIGGERFTVETFPTAINEYAFSESQKIELGILYKKDPMVAVDQANAWAAEIVLAEEAKNPGSVPLPPESEAPIPKFNWFNLKTFIWLITETERQFGKEKIDELLALYEHNPKAAVDAANELAQTPDFWAPTVVKKGVPKGPQKFSVAVWTQMTTPPTVTTPAAPAPPKTEAQPEKHLGFKIADETPAKKLAGIANPDLQQIAAQRCEPYVQNVGDGYAIIVYPRVGQQRADITLANFMVFLPGDFNSGRNHINASRQNDGMYINFDDPMTKAIPVAVQARIIKAAKELFMHGQIVKVTTAAEVRDMYKRLQPVPTQG